MTWRDTASRVETLAAGLLALGIEPEQRVGIASSTRFEWILADLAIMCAGAATTTVYANTAADDTAYILGDSECRIVFAENDEQLAKLAQRRRDLPDLTQVVLVDGAAVLRQRSARHAAPPAANQRADHVHDAQALVTHHRLAPRPQSTENRRRLREFLGVCYRWTRLLLTVIGIAFLASRLGRKNVVHRAKFVMDQSRSLRC